MTNKQRRIKLRTINDLIFELEESYPRDNFIRLSLFKARCALGLPEQYIRDAQEAERRADEDEALRY